MVEAKPKEEILGRQCLTMADGMVFSMQVLFVFFCLIDFRLLSWRNACKFGEGKGNKMGGVGVWVGL